MNKKTTLYMCPPKYLELSYSINPWTNLQSEFNVKKAS